MRRGIALAALALLVAGARPAAAGAMDRALAKLAPEERSHQVCILKGLDIVRMDARLRKADRIQTSIFAPASLQGGVLTAKGGAVRAANRWYAISFTCKLSPDHMKAVSFSFALGNEIPERSWEKHGLWR